MTGLWFLNFRQAKEEYQLLPVALPVHYDGKQFAGSESCIPCHEDIYKTHLATAHEKTSALASDKTLFGNFGSDTDRIQLMGSRVQMGKDDDTHYQSTEVFGRDTSLDTSIISMVIGSGTKGQSHLTWKNDSLYQLQASYFRATDDWMNSPGFPNYPFKRPITDDCIKCHVTFARNESSTGKTNVYDKTSFIYGISCERCHGPLQEHVVHHSNTPTDTVAHSVIKIGTIHQQLQLDVCAQCHSGLRAAQVDQNPFAYVVGEKMEDYSKNFYQARPNANLDVHSNQYGLLKSSECFKNTEVMTCTTCHNPHAKQRGETDYFNAKCVECHSKPDNLHKNFVGSVSNASQNCIECHMPVFSSETMKVHLEDENAKRFIGVRTHLIGVYVDSLLQVR